jgi:hypothetical protein
MRYLSWFVYLVDYCQLALYHLHKWGATFDGSNFRSNTSTVQNIHYSTATIEENLKKSRRALYSLMRSGLHGEKGLDPVTSISILRTYVIPIMFYGLETLLPSGKSFETLEKQYKKMIKQVLSLPIKNISCIPLRCLKSNSYVFYFLSGFSIDILIA